MQHTIHVLMGVVGWGKGSLQLFSPGCPTNIDLSWAMPAVFAAGKGRGRMLLFLLFLLFHSPLSSLSLSFIYSTIPSISFLPFSGRWNKMTHKGWHVVKPLHNQCTCSAHVHRYVHQPSGRPIIIWGAPNRNWPYDIREQGTPMSACASAGSMQTI